MIPSRADLTACGSDVQHSVGASRTILAALTTDEQIHCSTIEWVEQDV
jgi:hypothetical protein